MRRRTTLTVILFGAACGRSEAPFPVRPSSQFDAPSPVLRPTMPIHRPAAVKGVPMAEAKAQRMTPNSCLASHCLPTWTQVSTVGPSPRVALAMAFDSARERAVLFGGSVNGNVVGDTWEWDGATWSQASASGAPPRDLHGMAYDSARGRTVIFGGWSDATEELADTWEWDGAVWTQVATSGPSRRMATAMAYDSARARTVLFGGSVLPRGVPQTSAVDYGDTWEWDGVQWTQVASTGPSPRHAHAMAYDSVRGKTVLFAGAVASGQSEDAAFLYDAWEWDGATWTQVASPGTTTGGNGDALAFDQFVAQTVLFGADVLMVQSETMRWDGTTWVAISPPGPSDRYMHGMVYDSLRMKLVLFGGWSLVDGSDLGDTWEY